MSKTEIESQIWKSFGGLSVRRRKGEKGQKVQGLRSIMGRYKIGGC